ncbi:MAG: 4'-phosphopantetheinyl transferase family protein [Mucilaginibacter sp.]
MKSIGNDIVALNAIDIQRSRNPAFYSKFVTGAELELYHQEGINTLPLAHFVWLLWSIKESAYKYLKRADEELIFAPVKIIVHSLVSSQKPTTSLSSKEENNDDAFYCGEVIYRTDPLFFRTTITGQYIATLACHEPLFTHIHWGINSIDDISTGNQSTAVREFALKEIQSITKYKHPQIVKTTAGVPVIFNEDLESAMPISLAHHSNFVSYAFYYSSLNV